MNILLKSSIGMFDSFNAIWGYLIFGLILGFLIYLCIKFKTFAKIGIYLIFGLILIVGSVSAVHLYNLFDIESKEIGNAIHFQEDDKNYTLALLSQH